MITIHLIDNQNIYTGSAEIEETEPLPRCVLTEPPETTGTEVAKWQGDRWEVLPERPPEPKRPAFDAKVESVKAEADERIEAGAPHNGTRWPADAESQLAKASVAASVGAGKGLPKNGPSITARDITRTKHTMSEADYLSMSTAVRDYVFSVKETADDHIDALMALLGDDTKTAADIQAHDTSTGWPV